MFSEYRFYYNSLHLLFFKGFYIEWFVTAVFLFVLGYLNDRNASEHGYGLFFPPLMVGFMIAIITASFAPLTSTCMNPARDLGPRLLTYIAGMITNFIGDRCIACPIPRLGQLCVPW